MTQNFIIPYSLFLRLILRLTNTNSIISLDLYYSRITDVVFGTQADHFVFFSESTLKYLDNNKIDVT
jgi:hypothetical protein